MIAERFKKLYHLLKRIFTTMRSWHTTPPAYKLHPPSTTETELITNLRQKMNQLESQKISIESEWATRLHQLRQDIKNKDPRGFLQWDVIRQTMFHECREAELNYLKKLNDWPMWKIAIQESTIGNPRRYPKMSSSSGNLIHSAYHVARFLSFNNLDITKLNIIFEFGGGYGSLCRLFYRLGFRGQYIIYDLPEFSLLQEYFLRSLDMELNVTTAPTTNHYKTAILVSNINELPQYLLDTYINMFIATWSLSEAPISLRKEIVKHIGSADNYLIAYQEHFGNINNTNYFNDLILHHANYIRQEYPITHLPSNHYLFGKKTNA